MAEPDLYDDILSGNLSPVRTSTVEVLLELGARRVVLRLPDSGCPLRGVSNAIKSKLATDSALRAALAGGRLVVQRRSDKFDTWVDMVADDSPVKDGERLKCRVVPQLELGEVVSSDDNDGGRASGGKRRKRAHRQRSDRSSRRHGRHRSSRRHRHRSRSRSHQTSNSDSSEADGSSSRRRRHHHRRRRHQRDRSAQSDNSSRERRRRRHRHSRRRRRRSRSHLSRSRSRSRSGGSRSKSGSRSRSRTDSGSTSSSVSISSVNLSVVSASSVSGSRASSPPAKKAKKSSGLPAPPPPTIGPVGAVAREMKVWKNMDPEFAEQLRDYKVKRTLAAEDVGPVPISDEELPSNGDSPRKNRQQQRPPPPGMFPDGIGDHNGAAGDDGTPLSDFSLDAEGDVVVYGSKWALEKGKGDSVAKAGSVSASARTETAGIPAVAPNQPTSLPSRVGSITAPAQTEPAGSPSPPPPPSSGQLQATCLHLANKNAIAGLHEYCTVRRWPPPNFQLTELPGPTRKQPLFKGGVRVDGKMYHAPKSVTSKKDAKRDAARICLEALGVFVKDDSHFIPIPLPVRGCPAGEY